MAAHYYLLNYLLKVKDEQIFPKESVKTKHDTALHDACPSQKLSQNYTNSVIYMLFCMFWLFLQKSILISAF